VLYHVRFGLFINSQHFAKMSVNDDYVKYSVTV